jgi:hypothetical protein
MSKNIARRRSAALMSVAALATTGFIATAGSAGAAITAGAGTDAQDRPNFFRDGEGVRVVLCQDAVNCEPADPADPDPLHGGYFSAEAVAGNFRVVFAVETAATEDEATGELNPNEAMVSSVAVYDAENLQPGARYVIKHPWGQRAVRADNRGRVRVVDEAGGESTTPISAGTAKTFLRRLNAPQGFLGTLEGVGRVTGSPSGFNRIAVSGPGNNVVQRNWIVNGQLVEDMPMTSVSAK